jgi:hypothetical protein
MARELLPFFNETTYGSGLEGVANYTNEIGGNFVLPAFLVALYGISIYIISQSNMNIGGGVFFVSFLFFLLAMIAQTFVTFSQMLIFVFFVGMIVGIVLYFVTK